MQCGRFQRWSWLRKFTYAACAFFMLSYICFNILDLDGSDLPGRAVPLNRAVVVAQTRNEFEIRESLLLPAPHIDLFLPVFVASSDRSPIRTFGVVIPQNHDFSRSHRYRVGLPRSAPDDPLQSF